MRRGNWWAVIAVVVIAVAGCNEEKSAIELFRRAAIQGYVEAQYYLALCYRDGEGVPKNQAEADKWFRRAAIKSKAK